MSGNIPNPAPRSTSKPTGEYRMSSPEKRPFKTKARRSKTPERSLAHVTPSFYPLSSAESGSEAIDHDINRSFYESNRPAPRGRKIKKENARHSKSYEQPLQLPDQPPQYMPDVSGNYPVDPHGMYDQGQWNQQRSYSHHHSSTQPNPVLPQQQHLNSGDINELMELRVRSEQMEKTLRWWSECTANWREKWTKVRSERNRARDELKQFKVNLDEAQKELVVLRQQRGLLIQENTMLKNEVRLKDGSGSEESGPALKGSSRGSFAVSGSNSAYKQGSPSKPGRNSTSGSQETNKMDEDQLSHKLAALQLKVDESAKTIQAERDAKLSLNKTIEQQEQEISSLKQKYNEMKDTKQDALKQISRMQDSHRSEVVRVNQNLEEELQNRSQMEKKIHDLREEIEKLQTENTSEWGKRERLETDKLQLERDNKRLKSLVDEMRSSLDRKRKSVAEDRDNELRMAQAEVQDMNEELSNLRRQSARDQKQLDDRQEELLHSRRRAEQHETEVRQLRNRVEELKKQQTNTEDELDNAQNQSRKLLRIVEEKEEEIEKLHLQVDQMHTRMRREPVNTSWSKSLSYSKRDVDNQNSSDSSCEI